jgi:hypothetical protein
MSDECDPSAPVVRLDLRRFLPVLMGLDAFLVIGVFTAGGQCIQGNSLLRVAASVACNVGVVISALLLCAAIYRVRWL